MVEKTINIKAKASLQLSSKIKKIDFKYSKRYKPAKKNKTNKNNWDYQNKIKIYLLNNSLLPMLISFKHKLIKKIKINIIIEIVKTI